MSLESRQLGLVPIALAVAIFAAWLAFVGVTRPVGEAKIGLAGRIVYTTVGGGNYDSTERKIKQLLAQAWLRPATGR